jgi:hypothetical protein
LRLALLARSQRGKNRLAMLILAEYIVSLVVVTMAAIFFWALIISIAGTDALPLSESLRRSAEHFFPGADPPHPGAPLPFFATIGPAATSWILFGLYIGLAGSLVREWQRLASGELTNATRVVRDQAAILKQAVQKREEMKKALRQRELPEGDDSLGSSSEHQQPT